MKQIADDFQKQTGVTVRLNLGASSLLERQIEEGALADLFLSADEAKMDSLQEKGLIDVSSRRDLLGNALVIVVPSDARIAIKSPADLLRPEVRKIALSDPQVVPAGIYARKFLERIQLFGKLQSRIVPTENVRAALAAVEAGNADAAFVYKTDAAISNRVQIAYAVPEGEAPPISYPVAIVRETKERAAAEKFVAYLQSPAAAAVFARFGFALKK
jgi:molybdate transport system substrate-binding protein